MKIDFEFKQGDYVELAGMSDEQVEAVFKKMCQDGASPSNSRYPFSETLIWDFEGDIYYSNCVSYECHSKESTKEDIESRNLTLEDIFPESFNPNLVSSASKSSEDFYKENREHDEDSWVDVSNDTDVENTRTPLEECCEGGEMSAGCYHDNCTGTNSKEGFDLQDVTTWNCFKEVAGVLGSEDAEWELSKVLRQINDGEITENGFGEELNLENDSLDTAFYWDETQQGASFWHHINAGIKPKDYDTTPDTPSAKKPKLVIPESVVGDIKETFTEADNDLPEQPKETIGSLIEKLYNKLPPSGVQIVISEAGIYLTGAEMPTVDISKMEPEVIDKTFETFVECEGLWVLSEDDYEEDV